MWRESRRARHGFAVHACFIAVITTCRHFRCMLTDYKLQSGQVHLQSGLRSFGSADLNLLEMNSPPANFAQEKWDPHS